LGSEKQQERDAASARLVALGVVALPALREARKDADAEVARRARFAVEDIVRETEVNLPLTVTRVLRRRHPPGTEEALLRYLPFAGGAETEEEICYGLDALTESGGGASAALVRALADPLPARRAVAACIVSRIGTAEQQAIVERLLKDREPVVRLRAAQGFLTAKKKVGVPVLIALLEEAPVQVAWQAEELLCWLAGDAAPAETVGAGKVEARTRSRRGWEGWWKVCARPITSLTG
jgi:HEAT repeat protein